MPREERNPKPSARMRRLSAGRLSTAGGRMNFNYHKTDYRGMDDSMENGASKGGEEAKADDGREHYGCRNEVEDSELKSSRNLGKEGPNPGSKPEDVKNGDLVSLLLAATPPYLYNIPLIPQTFFFSEMLKSFVHAKAERQTAKVQQTHHKRQRKRSWREATPPKPSFYENADKPLELTMSKQAEERAREKPAKRCHPEGFEKKYQRTELGSSNFTAENLANSSIAGGSAPERGSLGSDLLPPTPPLWYPPLYPPHPPFGIDPLHFFIDLRVSAHVWDRKLTADKLINDPVLSIPPLNLRNEAKKLGDVAVAGAETSPGKNRHKSAFTVPLPRREGGREEGSNWKRSPHSVHYLMSNLKCIYKSGEAKDRKAKEGKNGDEKAKEKCKDLRALIGLELVVDYVKQESDDEERGEALAAEPVPEEQTVPAGE